MNDLERAREKRTNAKKKWRGVTNELVVSYANPDCKACSGHGYLGSDAEGEVCEEAACASELFGIAFKGRMRHNASRNRLEVFV